MSFPDEITCPDAVADVKAAAAWVAGAGPALESHLAREGAVLFRGFPLAEELSVDLARRRADVALIDNLVVMHGRRPFVGPRVVLASLVA